MCLMTLQFITTFSSRENCCQLKGKLFPSDGSVMDIVEDPTGRMKVIMSCGENVEPQISFEEIPQTPPPVEPPSPPPPIPEISCIPEDVRGKAQIGDR